MKHHAWHAFIWKIFGPAVRLITRILFGYTCERVEVDGPFLLDQRNLELHFRGSENQRLIDMKKTRATGTVTLCDL